MTSSSGPRDRRNGPGGQSTKSAAAAAAQPASEVPPRLALAVLGVVFGDIGTSPLYAVRECFFGEYAVAATRANVLGVLSLMLWALILIVSLKYLALVMRADNRGEGGILALTALLRGGPGSRRGQSSLVLLGLFGAALLYGDGMITPAISVLSAVEGLKVATPIFEPWVIPLTIMILAALFLFQHRGTERLGAYFGPITLLWFAVLAGLGIRGIAHDPTVFVAANPVHALRFLAANGMHGGLVLAAVFLVVTGAEALYADMGHFGARPIQLTWFAVVLPALVLNYLGQGALLLENPASAAHPFFHLVPPAMVYPLVGLATVATVIASQAVISGCFSLTRQAIQLGYSPRLPIEHTSEETIGQIYVPPVNWALMIAAIALVLGFGSASKLAAAYGLGVATTMVITTILLFVLARRVWGWSLWLSVTVTVGLMVIDLAFLAANFAKIAHGGWVPLLVGAIILMLFTTWRRGRAVLRQSMQASSMPLQNFLDDLRKHPPQRVLGKAIFMTGNPFAVPPALLHNLKHNKVLHEQVGLLTVVTAEVPHISREKRLEVESLGEGIYRLVAHYGFMETPNVWHILARAEEDGVHFDVKQTSFFLGRETLIASKHRRMANWRRHLFALMSRNAQSATAFFRISPDRIVELGAQVEL